VQVVHRQDRHASLLSPAGGHESSFTDAGWTRTAGAAPARPRASQVIAEIEAAGPIYLTLGLESAWGHHAESYRLGLREFHLEYGSRVLAGMVGYRVGPVRLAAGPAVGLTSWETAVGPCACIDTRRAVSHQTGVAASAAIGVHVARRITGELRVEGRSLAPGSADPYDHTPAFEFGGSQVGIGVGVSVGRAGR
jgi:hypothetical protein